MPALKTQIYQKFDAPNRLKKKKKKKKTQQRRVIKNITLITTAKEARSMRTFQTAANRHISRRADNEENLSEKGADELKKLRFEFKDRGTASMLKEYLRNIYKIANSYSLARTAFLLWCKKAETSGAVCLKQMAKRFGDGLMVF